MNVELKVLGYAALLQVVQFIIMAVPVNLQLGVAYTGGNRDEQKQAYGVPGRLKRALDNHFEGLILFTIAVVVVTLGEAGSPADGRWRLGVSVGPQSVCAGLRLGGVPGPGADLGRRVSCDGHQAGCRACLVDRRAQAVGLLIQGLLSQTGALR